MDTQGWGTSDRRVGPYRLLGLIGRGGMGDVYRAVRDDDHFEKVVAVKLVRTDVATELVHGRLRIERQILAGLEHPGIARLLDGGATADGRPFLVMEYVEGTPIDTHAADHGLDVRARLVLFRAVCEAVQYAHQNLVVHRDLKPANILVSADGVPKLLDFGVAKLVAAGAEAEPTITAFPAMTPAYASPEQFRGDAITTATDVYSLGAVLYELLTGVRPHRFAPGVPLQLAICDRVPERPSVVVRQGQAGVRARRPIRPDLDAIVLKALRKEPLRRYPTVEAFSEDVGRYLQGLPVAAARGSALYRAGKFVRRNWVAVGLALGVLGLGTAFAVDRGIQARRLARERDRGERVTAFLIDLFRIADPGEARGSTVTAREVLDRGTARLETDLKDEPEVRAALLDTISQVHSGLGLYGKAVTLARQGLEARRRSLGDRHPDVAASLASLGDAAWQSGDHVTAEASYRESLALRRASFGPEHRLVAASLQGVAQCLRERGEYQAAEQSYRQALVMQRRLLGDGHPDVASSLNGLARVMRAKGDYAAAEAMHRECLDLRRRLFGEADPRVIASLNNLAVVLYLQGKPEAVARFRENLAATRALVAADHPLVTTGMANLAGAVADFDGDYDEADALAQDVLRRERATFGPEHTEVARALDNRAAVLLGKGDAVAAEAYHREASAMWRRLFGPEHPNLALSLSGLALARQQQGDDAGADALDRRALAMTRKLVGERTPQAASVLSNLGRALLGQGRLAEAEESFREAVAILEPVDRTARADLAYARTGLADALARAGRAGECAAPAREAVEARRAMHPADHPALLEAESVLGGCLAAARRFEEAEVLLRDRATSLARRGRLRDAQDAAQRAIRMSEAWGRPESAGESRRFLTAVRANGRGGGR
ncbi:MAG: serine/threonine-protein kinase [Vicinamibacteria bacterium]